MKFEYIVLNLMISIIVAVLTSTLSVRGFYKQEVCLRKETRYSQIIENLSKLQKYYGDEFNKRAGFGMSDSNDDENLIKKEYNLLRLELEVTALSPGFILNKEVSNILDRLIHSSNNLTSDERMGDFASYFDRMYGEIRDAKTRIIIIANEDLGIDAIRS